MRSVRWSGELKLFKCRRRYVQMGTECVQNVCRMCTERVWPPTEEDT